MTAAATVKHPRSSRDHVFGIFTPSKNYRFQAASDKDAEDWVSRIGAEAPIDETEIAFLALSATNRKCGGGGGTNFSNPTTTSTTSDRPRPRPQSTTIHYYDGNSSPTTTDFDHSDDAETTLGMTKLMTSTPTAARWSFSSGTNLSNLRTKRALYVQQEEEESSTTPDNDFVTSQSECSDGPGPDPSSFSSSSSSLSGPARLRRGPTSSLFRYKTPVPVTVGKEGNKHKQINNKALRISSPSHPPMSTNTTPLTGAVGVLRHPEKVLCEGYLQCLQTKGSVRQWKRYWVVLRPKSIAFYKDEQVCMIFHKKKKKKKKWQEHIS